MNKYMMVVFLFALLGCSKSEDSSGTENLTAKVILNAAYGSDPAQVMDVYLPAGRNMNTKTVVLVHGGAWSGGDKSSFDYFVPVLQARFPGYAIVNINYRLGTLASPGFPKQIEDIEAMVAFLKSSDYRISNDLAFIGASAGAHLSMLYAYHYDSAREVKAVCSIVGPTDFTDPSYVDNPLTAQFGLSNLVGNFTYQQNPAIYAEVSPRTHVSASSAPTIMFYGGQDPLIPATQGPRLKERLDSFGVYNEFNLYPTGGHGDWDAATMTDMVTKMEAFLEREL